MPVNKTGGAREHKPTLANVSCHSTSLQNLIPTGWAPGPAGEGTTFKLPPLEIVLPKEYTAPLAHEHYEVVRNQLHQRIRAGGQDAITVIINGRLTTQVPGRIKPTIINVVTLLCDSFSDANYSLKCETIADVPIRIDHENLQRLLLNAFLSDWLKRFMNYPLDVRHIVSVRLIKGRSGIYLDNKDHAILEHCLSPDGSKLTATMLDIMLLLDVDHYEKAQAHRKSTNAQLEDQLEDLVHFFYWSQFLCSHISAVSF